MDRKKPQLRRWKEEASLDQDALHWQREKKRRNVSFWLMEVVIKLHPLGTKHNSRILVEARQPTPIVTSPLIHSSELDVHLQRDV